MKSVYNTLAGKWFIDNVNELTTENIPVRVLTSLANFTDEGLYILADEMVWGKLSIMFEEYKGIDVEDSSSNPLEEQELDDFLNHYRQENFSSFKTCEELIDFLICKMEFALEITVSWSQGCIKLTEHITFWDFIEDKARLHHARGKRVKSQKVLNPQKCAKIVGEEKTYKDRIKDKLQEKDYKAASDLVQEYKSFLERKNGGSKSADEV